MDWHENSRPFLPLPDSSLSFFYNYNNPYPVEVKQAALAETPERLLPTMGKMNYRNREKKKRLTSNQIDLLERSFQGEMKLDPERKMKLSRELGLQPRQIAVWFQNRRTRWKSKQLEHLYDVLKQQFDVISNEKQRLQEEVMKLKAMLTEKGFGSYTEISGEETVESPSEALRCSNNIEQVAEGHYTFPVEDYNNTVSLPPCHWSFMPYYP